MKLIDKDIVKIEIEKIINEIYAGQPFDSLSREQQVALWYVKSIMTSVDTLEVKEEILDSNDIKEAFKSGYDMAVIQTTKKMNSNTKKVDLDLEITLWANAIPEIRLDDVERLAKHFFELGIKAQKGE